MTVHLKVSTSGYYAWPDREPSPRSLRQERIHRTVRQVHADSQGIYGSQKVASQLAPAARTGVGLPKHGQTVAKAVRESGLKSRIPRAFTLTTT